MTNAPSSRACTAICQILGPLVPAHILTPEVLEKIEAELRTIASLEAEARELKCQYDWLDERDRLREENEERARIVAKIRSWVDNPGPEVPVDELLHDVAQIWPWVESQLNDPYPF